MNKQINLGLILAALLLTVACSTEKNQSVTSRTTAPQVEEVVQRDNALVRVINAVPAATSLDVFADDQKVFENVPFKSVTPYQELSDNRHTFRVRSTGRDTAQPIAENSHSFNRGKHYTIVVIPDTNDNTTLYVINDNIAPPPEDMAQVRVIHASPDAEVDIIDQQGNKTLFSRVNFEREIGYMDIDPSKTTIHVRPEGQDKALLTMANANFEEGKLYTIVVTGHVQGTPKLRALMMVNYWAPLQVEPEWN